MSKQAIPISLSRRQLAALFGATLLTLSSFSTMFGARLANATSSLQPTAKVSFTFDDGLSSAILAANTLKPYGITGTSYVISGCIGMAVVPNTCAADNNKSYMTSAQIQQLHDQYGWEIGSHTVTHPQLAIADGAADGSLPGGAAQVTTELTQSKQTLAGIVGSAPSDFAFPYGDYDDNALSEAAKYYESARGFADLGYNTFPYNNSLVINDQVQEGKTANSVSGVTYAQVKTYIDTAMANNQWLVLTFHNVSATTPTSADDYTTSTALLGQIAQYVQQQQAANKIKAVNVTDGITRGTDLLTNGDFAHGIADGWTTDSANITADAGNNGRYPEPTHAVSLKTAVGATSEGHLFSPKVAVTFGNTYVLKNYVHMISGGSVNFYIDEYDANGQWISGKDPAAGLAYSSVATGVNVSDINFTYTPSSANVAKASLQVIVRGNGTSAYYDGAQWLTDATVTPPSDTTAPVISAVISTPASTGATIAWTTDEASTTQVNYGTTTAYGSSTTLDNTLGTQHTATISGLSAGTTYHFQVVSKDASGNAAVSGDYAFTTAAATNKAGDANGDGVVNIKDATLVSLNWGKTGMTLAQGDLNGDGTVNIKDATLVSLNWGK